jgi:hypothetical protein
MLKFTVQILGTENGLNPFYLRKPVLWIRIGFNADSDPAFILSQC